MDISEMYSQLIPAEDADTGADTGDDTGTRRILNPDKISSTVVEEKFSNIKFRGETRVCHQVTLSTDRPIAAVDPNGQTGRFAKQRVRGRLE